MIIEEFANLCEFGFVDFGVFQKMLDDGGGFAAEHVGDHVAQGRFGHLLADNGGGYK